ncbi:AhpC/TSA family protein [Biscogniauxia marginata]|nr:AhpC/TSA family protein [Biscogniauxia marginata]
MAFRAATRRIIPTSSSFSRPMMASASASASATAPVPVSARFAAPRSFHSTPRAFVKVGDEVPNIEVLHEDSPANKVNLAKEFGLGVPNGLIIGVPAAFSGTCSQKHIPSYINHPKLADAGQVFVVSVNDAFVMKAWADQLDPTRASGIRFLADPTAAFTKELDLGFDATPIFGGVRSKRYALVVKDGKIKTVHVEPDNTGTSVSMAEEVLH